MVVPGADAAAMPLDDSLDDREHQSASTRSFSSRVNLVEALEDERQMLVRDPSARVANAQHQAVRHGGTPQGDRTTLWGMTQRIRGQVLQCLLESIRVADHDLGTRLYLLHESNASLLQL